VDEHPSLTPFLDTLAQRTTRPDGLVETDGREEGAEEELGVGVTPCGEQRSPGGGLLRDLGQGLVMEEVGQAHLRVANAPTEAHVQGDVYAFRRTADSVTDAQETIVFVVNDSDVMIFYDVRCGRCYGDGCGSSAAQLLLFTFSVAPET